MLPSSLEVRPPVASELAALAAFVAGMNAHPGQRSLHCPAASPAAVRTALRDPQQFPFGWEHGFSVAVEHVHGEITGAFGLQVYPGETVGYLWGPWITPTKDDWRIVAPALLSTLLANTPAHISRLDAFLDVENRAGLHFLAAHGFSAGPLTHLYLAGRSGWTLSGKDDPARFCPPLRPAHEVAFARLHADTFPADGSTPAQALLDGRDDEHAIFTATDGLRLLGSICVSVNRAPLEGFVDYLAVRPAARGRGVGQRLLQTALHWAFGTKALPQMALTVSDWRADARRLYERAGFAWHASGRAARRRV